MKKRKSKSPAKLPKKPLYRLYAEVLKLRERVRKAQLKGPGGSRKTG